MKASRPIVRLGEACEITWDARNASSVLILPEPGLVASSGRHIVKPQNSMWYLIAAVDDRGAADVQTVRLEVANAPALHRPIELPTGSIVASPDSMVGGKPAQLKWSTYNATTVAILPTIGFVGGAGEMDVFPQHTTTFHMFIANGYSTASTSVQVQVYRWPSTTSGS